MKSHSQTLYFIEVQIGKNRKVVPHTGTKYCKFIEGKKATAFMNEQKAKNPDLKYRIVKETTSYSEGKWI